MERKVYVRTIHLLLIISVGLVSLGLGSTYAIFTSSAEIDNPISLSSNLSYDSEIIETVPMDVSKGETKEITLNINNTSGKNLNYVIWKIDYGYNTDIVASEISGCTDTVGMISSSSSCTVKILVRNNVNESIRVIVGVSSSDSSVVLDSSMKIIEKGSLEERKINQIASTYITNLYMNANKSIVTNNEIEYNYATSESLMNDRLGGTTESLDGGNIRYYGSSPNNYIYFNCDDYDNQTPDTCELWRIIGVFDGRIKIVRNESIGYLSWDYDYNDDLSSVTYSNNWETSSLNKLLNEAYLNNQDTVYYNSNNWNESTNNWDYYGPYLKTLNFNKDKIGIKDGTRDMIDNVTWYLGGLSIEGLAYPDKWYQYERSDDKSNYYSSNPHTTIGKIGLIYLSDYGYGMNFEKCINEDLENDSNIDCIVNNYLNKNEDTWLINQYASGSEYASITVKMSHDEYAKFGYVKYRNPVYGSNLLVYPTLYLNPDEVITGGTGEKEIPYKLAA